MQVEKPEVLEKVGNFQGGENAVDVSADSVDAEWERIVIEHESGPIPKAAQDESGGVKFEHAPADNGQSFEDKKRIAASVIMTGAKFFLGGVLGLKIGDDHYLKLANAYGALIAKRYKGGIFEFLAVWREELTAAGATILFAGVFRDALELKRAEDEDEKLARGSGGNSEAK